MATKTPPTKKRATKAKATTTKRTKQPAIVPRHQWTNGGDEILIAKCVEKDGRSYKDFCWPLTVGAVVEAPDWNIRAECGGGLHGWPWLFSVGDGKAPNYSGVWLVFGAKPGDVIDLGGKVKARRGVVRAVGSYLDVALFLHDGQDAWIQQAARGAASATGWSGAASATGRSGAASATGESGAASATGRSGAASATGLDGKAQAGPWGCIALAWWNTDAKRGEMRCARVGVGDGSDGLLKAAVWYRLDAAGEFVEATE